MLPESGGADITTELSYKMDSNTALGPLPLTHHYTHQRLIQVTTVSAKHYLSLEQESPPAWWCHKTCQGSLDFLFWWRTTERQREIDLHGMNGTKGGETTKSVTSAFFLFTSRRLKEQWRWPAWSPSPCPSLPSSWWVCRAGSATDYGRTCGGL